MWELLGLDSNDESVYRHHVSSLGSTVAQVAQATNLSEPDVAASQRHLIDCGLLYRTASGEIRAAPAGPAVVADRLRDELDAEYARRRRQLGLFKKEMTLLVKKQLLASSSSVPQLLVDRITSPEAATARVAELLCRAQAEVARTEPGVEAVRRIRTELFMPAEIKAVERGVDVRAIYPPTLLVSPAGRRLVDLEIRAGVSVRTTPTPATSLTIIDRCVAVLVDFRRDGSHHAFLVHEASLVHTMLHLFEICWAQATDARSFLADGGGADSDEVSSKERMVLRLLGEGLKDEALAKRLGMSVRTVRRMIFDLHRRLAADSRFQAGVLAARRHWV